MEPHDEALLEMVNQVRMKLLGAEIMVGLKKLDAAGGRGFRGRGEADGAVGYGGGSAGGFGVCDCLRR